MSKKTIQDFQDINKDSKNLSHFHSNKRRNTTFYTNLLVLAFTYLNQKFVLSNTLRLQSYYNGRKVCLSVCQPPQRLPCPWALGTCPHLPPQAAWGDGGWVAGSSFPADSVKFASSLSFVVKSGEWRPLNGPVFRLLRPPSSPFPPRPSLRPQSRPGISQSLLAIRSVAPSARYDHIPTTAPPKLLRL